MMRSNMNQQITKPPMKKKANGYMAGGKMKSGSQKRGYAKGGKVDQMSCSPRKRMAMEGMG